ncbi:MAG: DNA mismatch repair protein MutS [Clostridiaceae bacterium]|nr:DNA mismatch repair protein MutS [Clostridiaceae bacterium]
MSTLTPMMRQYMDIKNKHTDALLLFRLGDFYELFFDDAITASKELEITLTGRDCGLDQKAAMCGVPYHSATSYINKLVLKGYKVAICEQVEDASEAKGIVKRDVVRIITPGTLIDTDLLEEKKNNYLMCIYGCKEGFGLSYVDISTGELFSTEIITGDTKQRLKDEIAKIQPKEIIYYIEKQDALNLEWDLDLYTNIYDAWRFEYKYALEQLKEHFNILTVDGLGFSNQHLGVNSTGALLDYLKSTQKRSLNHLYKIDIYNLSKCMTLDLTTRKNLELTETIREKSKRGSLLWILDKTKTSMGGRMLRKWIEEPLLDTKIICHRLDAVEVLKEDILFRSELKDNLKKIYDLERLCARISYGSATPRDLVALKNSLTHLPSVKALLQDKNGSLFKNILQHIGLHYEEKELIEASILDEPSISLKEGNIIKTGYDKAIDELRIASTEGKTWISNLEKEERQKTGIKSLKIGFNKIFGYFIEVTKSNLHMVPQQYIRKQTLSNCERYITPELKEVETKILGSEEKVVLLEYQRFVEVRNKLEEKVVKIQRTASALAQLDALYSLAEVAAENGYIKPIMNNKGTIDIQGGRHPVVEKMLENNMFISNDTHLDEESREVAIITGPNMAGKSTYMRQVALIVLMAQVGSFVPATKATIGIVDRIFTRVGASDDLSQGQSTFMVEMSEMANILNNATSKSLLILDEIGRGTSTFDGLSIAWAVVEYISKFLKSKTLFSTHYHELTDLEGTMKGIKNYRISIKEDGDDIIFLRKVIEGSADKSYGIQVARLAGLPQHVINRARTILSDLEKNDLKEDNISNENTKTINIKEEVKQLNFIDFTKQEVIDDLKNVNLLETTPLDAINILYKLQKKVNVL